MPTPPPTRLARRPPRVSATFPLWTASEVSLTTPCYPPLWASTSPGARCCLGPYWGCPCPGLSGIARARGCPGLPAPGAARGCPRPGLPGVARARGCPGLPAPGVARAQGCRGGLRPGRSVCRVPGRPPSAPSSPGRPASSAATFRCIRLPRAFSCRVLSSTLATLRWPCDPALASRPWATLATLRRPRCCSALPRVGLRCWSRLVLAASDVARGPVSCQPLPGLPSRGTMRSRMWRPDHGWEGCRTSHKVRADSLLGGDDGVVRYGGAVAVGPLRSRVLTPRR